MEKPGAILVLFFMVNALTLQMASANIAQEPKAVEKWFKRLPYAKGSKITKLHFYSHDVVSGQHPTAITVAQANSTLQSPTSFGLTRVMDNILTVGPEPNSTIVGRAQGIYAFASLEEVSLLMTLNFVFTSGKYNGSTLSVLGHTPLLDKYREIPIVGGSGVFRLAQGIATVQVFSANYTTQDAVGEYDVVVLHY